jgi:hypothetical protein
MKSLAEGGCRAEIEERLSRLTAEDRALWGRMNVSQMAGHVAGAFAMVLGEQPVQPVRSLLRGPHGRYLALYSGVTWGRDIQTVPELDMVRLGVVPADFDRKTRELAGLLQRFCDAAEADLAGAHPMLGRMRRADWMRWGYLHTDHHLRQFGR